MFKNIKKNLKYILISAVCDLVCIMAGITAIYSCVHGYYLITTICLVMLGYLAYLERRGYISAW